MATMEGQPTGEHVDLHGVKIGLEYLSCVMHLLLAHHDMSAAVQHAHVCHTCRPYVHAVQPTCMHVWAKKRFT